MRASTILEFEGLPTDALSEAFVRVRAALGEKVEGGYVPRWGAGEGCAWLTTKKYRVTLCYYCSNVEFMRKSLLEISSSGEIPEADLRRLRDALLSAPLS